MDLVGGGAEVNMDDAVLEMHCPHCGAVNLSVNTICVSCRTQVGESEWVWVRTNADDLAEARFEAASDRWGRIASGWGPSCKRAKPDVDEQYSFGVYAGVMCGDCARTKYRDGCGLDGPQGNAVDLDEPLEEE